MRRLLTTGLLFLFCLFSTFVSFPNTTFAVDPGDVALVSTWTVAGYCLSAGIVASGCPPEAAAHAGETAKERILKPTIGAAFAITLINVASFVANRLAFEAAVWVASGATGQESLYQDTLFSKGLEKFGKDVAGEAIGQLSKNVLNDKLGIELDLCRPPGDLLTLGLQLGLKQAYQPQKPLCEFDTIVDNWSEFASNVYAGGQAALGTNEEARKMRNKFLLKKLAESLKPGQNALSASVRVNIKVHEAVAFKKQGEILDRSAKSDYKSVTEAVTGKITTPEQMVQTEVNRKLQTTEDSTKLTAANLLGADSDVWSALGMSAVNTFTNTLLSETLSGIYRGLFAPKSDNSVFDPELVSVNGTTEAQQQFQGMLTTTPLQVTEYSALSEFVVCPASNVMNRGLYNCVFDANFLSAVSRGNSPAPLTVQDAIDEGLLDGGRPLISPEDKVSNNDPNCYTYGYCYGNLVKLRNARILSIGWELAARANSSTNPKTLQEIVDQFDNCNAQGTIDSDHKFCHLIDPNWILKYPPTQCRAIVNGEIRMSALANGRNNVCVDSPSCLGQDAGGACNKGYGYCVEEKNVWRFRGDSCPEYFASCLSLENTTLKSKTAVLLQTVDFSVCNQSNAGCRWYRTNKYQDVHDVANLEDNTFEWLPTGESYATSGRADDLRYQNNGSNTSPQDYDYASAPAVPAQAYSIYSYEDRIYFNKDVKECQPEQAGCTAVNSAKDLTLNYVLNGSFENDENGDQLPDDWETRLGLIASNTNGSKTGGVAVSFENDNEVLSQRVPVQGGQFYTVSFYEKNEDLDFVSNPVLNVGLYNQNDQKLALGGLSFGGTCVVENGEYVVREIAGGAGAGGLLNPGLIDIGNRWKQLRCTFTTPREAHSVLLTFDDSEGNIIDDVQLQLGEVATDFTDGYSSTPQTAYLKVAPDYLNCQGLPTDHKDCGNYAGQCRAQDVGCNLYNPADGDPSVPAIVSAIDVCPNECVGYASYRQEKTLYDTDDGYYSFIPEKAKVCSEQNVGCDSFTNVEATAQGGEQTEYYSMLRRCVAPDKTDPGVINKKSATFFTWEGSDNSGYQLRSWELLESNTGRAAINYPVHPDDVHPDLAPCTMSRVQANGNLLEVVCLDVQGHLDALERDASCDEHTDIFTNPDCREFFDTAGNVHYRKFSDTVTVTDQCKSYRKDVSDQVSCDDTGGAWQVAQGTCRYFGFKEESRSCPATENGCRAYTGNSSRNVTTVVNEEFESGNYDHFSVVRGDVTISNESLAAAGHSLRISHGNNASVSVTTTDDQLEDVVAGRSLFLSLWAKGDTNLSVSLEGTNQVVSQFNSPDSEGPVLLRSIPLSGSWKLYQFNVLIMPEFAMDQHPRLTFSTSNNGTTAYLDNILLKMTSSQINVIKNSWVVPTACDTNPNGTVVPGYYLGCEAYTDQRGANSSLYQFTNLCSEKTIGCSAFYNTQNSDSPYGQVNNARCVHFDSANGSPASPTVVADPTPCEIDTKLYCTIPRDQSFCTFNSAELIPDLLPREGDFAIVYGPETVVVQADMPSYLIDNGSNTCSQQFAGCQEVGVPTYNQTLTQVTKFDSKFIINDPDVYESQLCNNEALFCDEFKHKSEGNFYFKDPINKTCEYKSAVQMSDRNGANHEISGWFRSGTQEPCYWTDTGSPNNRNTPNGVFDFGIDQTYLISGESAGIWYNGDEPWDGWVGMCEDSYDMCTEFVDIPDTSGGKNPDGQSYFYINNDKLKDANVTTGTKCEGRVSQKEGCAVFNNKTDSQLNYHAGASYILSAHADLLLNQQANDLVDPVDCSTNDGAGGEFRVSPAAATEINRKSNSIIPVQDSLNVCNRRCVYGVPKEDRLATFMSYGPLDCASGVGVPHCLNNFFDPLKIDLWFERPCLMDADCPAMQTVGGEEVQGSCTLAAGFRVINDSNRILKVNRDRECSAWLSCKSSRNSWNTQTNAYINICDSIQMCRKGKLKGETPLCIQPDEREAKILNAYEYSSRDVNWNGFDLSGYAIPNQLPVERYDQVDVGLMGTCSDITAAGGKKYSCESDADCGVKTCEPNASYKVDYRLVYDAGTCKSTVGTGSVGFGGNCQTGVCQKSGNSCISDTECDVRTLEQCVIGYCQATATTGGRDNNGKCVTNLDCTTANPDSANVGGVETPYCENGQCVDVLLSNKQNPCVVAADCGANKTCVTASTTSNGSCINDHCITAINDSNNDSFADRIQVNADELGISSSSLKENKQICRGYPEIDSPFPMSVVETWAHHNREGDLTGEAASPDHQSDTPVQFVSGYQDATTCAPSVRIENDIPQLITSDECSRTCSYKKVQYGGNFATKYYSMDTTVQLNADKVTGAILSGLCSSGENIGEECSADIDCGAAEGGGAAIKGSCVKMTGHKDVFGWQGYCLEQDSSILLYGTPSDGTHACLTWHPVDQLAGTTDLYAKYSTAGFTPQTLSYCAQIDTGYTIKTTQKYCAETRGNGNCNDAYNNGALHDDNPMRDVDCDPGYFAILSAGCGDASPSGCKESGDDDYPYFCVPLRSYTTAKDGDLVVNNAPVPKGTACLPPPPPNEESPWALNRYDQIRHHGDITIYVPNTRPSWRRMRDFYKSCETRGVTSKTKDLFIESGGEHSFETYAACYSTVNVATQDLNLFGSDRYNVAWTNMLWSGQTNPIQSLGNAAFAYRFSTELLPYGKAVDLEISEGDPDLSLHRVLMCEVRPEEGSGAEVIPVVNDAGAECPNERTSLSSVNHDLPETSHDARPYYEIEIDLDLSDGEIDATFCKNNQCNNCAVGAGVQQAGESETAVGVQEVSDGAGDPDEICNYINDPEAGEVARPVTCVSRRTCHGGDNDGISCLSGSDCGRLAGANSCNVENPEGTCTSVAPFSECYLPDSSGEDRMDLGECSNPCFADPGVTPPGESETYCDGGANEGRVCSTLLDCQPYYCAPPVFGVRDIYQCAYRPPVEGREVTQIENPRQAVERLKQLFAKSYFLTEFDDGYEGVRSQESENSAIYRPNPGWTSGEFSTPVAVGSLGVDQSFWNWDVRITGIPGKTPSAPQIWALSNCQNEKCEESPHDDGDAFTVSGPGGDQNSGVVEGIGSQTIDVKFYVQANSDQMPVRRIVVDWGDDLSSTLPWGTGSQTPPDAMSQGGNFYMNHRGMLDISDGDEYCESKNDDFGLSSEACSKSYVSMNHDYVCAPRHLSTLVGNRKFCKTDPTTGKLLNSPCTGGNIGVESEGACVFQPRVHVMDNWGWCTGVCPGGVDDSDGCFDGTDVGDTGQNECNVDKCPGPQCLSGIGSNPWINFGGGNGYIVIRPE